MKHEERLLFKELSKSQSQSLDENLLKFATPYVLGQLFFNRMQGVAYEKLKRLNLLNKTNREFRNSLKSAYEKNIEKNESFYLCVAAVSEVLSKIEAKTAMLKGAVLCGRYPKGCRTSNDIDLLVLPKDVTVVGNALVKAGFKQGSIINGGFIAASRKEIIESKMMRGETVPYIKEVNLPGMKYLEIDINFSLDYKNADNETLLNIMENCQWLEEQGISIPTLSNEDFFIHLCAHLYKEATTVPWIKMNRDMTLYKYCDIYVLLSRMSNEEIHAVFNRAKKLGLEKVCSYSVLETAELFDIDNFEITRLAQDILTTEPDFRITVVNPKDKKTLMYNTINVTDRFFLENRIEDLKGIK